MSADGHMPYLVVSAGWYYDLPGILSADMVDDYKYSGIY